MKARVALDVFVQRPSDQLEHGLQLRVLGGSKALHFGQRRRISRKQTVEPAESRQCVATQINSGSSGCPGSQEHREQLGVSQHVRAAYKQALARTFTFGPILDRHVRVSTKLFLS
jgi:hypothetical protein